MRVEPLTAEGAAHGERVAPAFLRWAPREFVGAQFDVHFAGYEWYRAVVMCVVGAARARAIPGGLGAQARRVSRARDAAATKAPERAVHS